jgi:hypothetical protein
MVRLPSSIILCGSEVPSALGLTDEVERFGLKGNKKKKGKKLDEDYMVWPTSTCAYYVSNA